MSPRIRRIEVEVDAEFVLKVVAEVGKEVEDRSH